MKIYVTFKLADDPSLDGNQLIEEDLCEVLWPGGRAPMKALYGRIEDLFTNPKYYPPEIQHSKAHQHQNEELAWGSLGTPPRMAEMRKLMDQAVAAAYGGAREAAVPLKLGIWDYMVEGRRLYEEHEKDDHSPVGPTFAWISPPSRKNLQIAGEILTKMLDHPPHFWL